MSNLDNVNQGWLPVSN